jgi:prepilin peptidase CpaA
MALLTLIAAVTDLHSRIIPNWLIIAGLAIGFGWNASVAGWAGLFSSALGFGLALLIYVPLFLLRGMGGGDVKLMAALGSMAGPQNWFSIWIMGSLIWGVIALATVVFRSAAGGVFWNMWFITKELVRLRMPYNSRPELDIAHARARTMPHGFGMALGTWFFLFNRFI